MHYETANLPADVHEVFFSGRYFYAASCARTRHGRVMFVGAGSTRDEAFADMREEAARAARPPAPTVDLTGEHAALDLEQRQILATNLRRLRTEKGVAQLDVARAALGFERSHAAVSRLERGALPRVPCAHLRRLADFYSTPVITLLQPGG
jgi:hypothetical protein